MCTLLLTSKMDSPDSLMTVAGRRIPDLPTALFTCQSSAPGPMSEITYKTLPDSAGKWTRASIPRQDAQSLCARTLVRRQPRCRPEWLQPPGVLQ
jgi:hypothetical protein